MHPKISFKQCQRYFFNLDACRFEFPSIFCLQRLTCVSCTLRSNSPAKPRSSCKGTLERRYRERSVGRKPGTLIHSVIAGRVHGGQGRDCPRRQWIDDVKRWTGMSAVFCARVAADRRESRRRHRAVPQRPTVYGNYVTCDIKGSGIGTRRFT